MYSASSAFHNAIANDEHQIALLIFNDSLFTNSDIDVTRGIEFHDYFNLEENMSIGQTPSNEISFTLFNDDGHLNNYNFGEFEALLGVRIGKSSYKQQGTASMTTKYASYVGNASYPFLTRNGVPVSAQPNFAVNSMASTDDKVYVFGSNGRYAVYDDKTGANITNSTPVDSSMGTKSSEWDGRGYYYNKETRIMFVYTDGSRERYEFVPLGKFSAVRPDVPDQITIDFTCNDFMTKFDIDMPSAEETGMEFPTTLKKLLKDCCTLVGVECGVTGDFINSSLEVEKEPEAFKTATMREVIGWIAEAAGSNAGFDRDGKLQLKWLKTSSSQHYDEHNYTDFSPSWYKTKPIDRLLNRDTENSADDVTGSGSNGYLIQDNPFLRVEGKEPETDRPWEKIKDWPPLTT